MHLPAFWPWIAVGLVLVGLRLVGIPGRQLVIWGLKFVAGAAVLWVVDVLAAPAGVQLGVNPISSAAVGFLGVPGILMVAGSRFILTGSFH